MKDLKEYVRTTPDHPKPGIMFRDVTSVLQDADDLIADLAQALDAV